MSNVPIVQGYAVSDGIDDKYQSSYHNNNNNSSSNQGAYGYAPNHSPAVAVNDQELRELRDHPIKQCQDAVWGVLFVAHLCAVCVMIAMGLSSGNGLQTGSYNGIIFLTGVTGLSALALSTAALSFMMQNAEALVQMALIFSVCTSLAVAILGFMIGSILMGSLALISFAFGCCYAKIVWPRIPFAAANLNTALSAVRANLGLSLVSFFFTAIAFAWTILWFLGIGDALAGSNTPVLFLLVRMSVAFDSSVSIRFSIAYEILLLLSQKFLSYYWVHQVLQNTMHVTTAGVSRIEINSCCSCTTGK